MNIFSFEWQNNHRQKHTKLDNIVHNATIKIIFNRIIFELPWLLLDCFPIAAQFLSNLHQNWHFNWNRSTETPIRIRKSLFVRIIYRLLKIILFESVPVSYVICNMHIIHRSPFAIVNPSNCVPFVDCVDGCRVAGEPKIKNRYHFWYLWFIGKKWKVPLKPV